MAVSFALEDTELSREELQRLDAGSGDATVMPEFLIAIMRTTAMAMISLAPLSNSMLRDQQRGDWLSGPVQPLSVDEMNETLNLVSSELPNFITVPMANVEQWMRDDEDVLERMVIDNATDRFSSFFNPEGTFTY